MPRPLRGVQNVPKMYILASNLFVFQIQIPNLDIYVRILERLSIGTGFVNQGVPLTPMEPNMCQKCGKMYILANNFFLFQIPIPNLGI